MANRTLTTWEEKPNENGYNSRARIERVYTKEELDRRLAGLREDFENRRAKTRERFDGYQEELLKVIRRRNSEKEALIAQIERLGKQVYGLGGEPVV